MPGLVVLMHRGTLSFCAVLMLAGITQGVATEMEASPTPNGVFGPPPCPDQKSEVEKLINETLPRQLEPFEKKIEYMGITQGVATEKEALPTPNGVFCPPPCPDQTLQIKTLIQETLPRQLEPFKKKIEYMHKHFLTSANAIEHMSVLGQDLRSLRVETRELYEHQQNLGINVSHFFRYIAEDYRIATQQRIRQFDLRQAELEINVSEAIRAYYVQLYNVSLELQQEVREVNTTVQNLVTKQMFQKGLRQINTSIEEGLRDVNTTVQKVVTTQMFQEGLRALDTSINGSLDAITQEIKSCVKAAACESDRNRLQTDVAAKDTLLKVFENQTTVLNKTISELREQVAQLQRKLNLKNNCSDSNDPLVAQNAVYVYKFWIPGVFIMIFGITTACGDTYGALTLDPNLCHAWKAWKWHSSVKTTRKSSLWQYFKKRYDAECIWRQMDFAFRAWRGQCVNEKATMHVKAVVDPSIIQTKFQAAVVHCDAQVSNAQDMKQLIRDMAALIASARANTSTGAVREYLDALLSDNFQEALTRKMEEFERLADRLRAWITTKQYPTHMACMQTSISMLIRTVMKAGAKVSEYFQRYVANYRLLKQHYDNKTCVTLKKAAKALTHLEMKKNFKQQGGFEKIKNAWRVVADDIEAAKAAKAAKAEVQENVAAKAKELLKQKNVWIPGLFICVCVGIFIVALLLRPSFPPDTFENTTEDPQGPPYTFQNQCPPNDQCLCLTDSYRSYRNITEFCSYRSYTNISEFFSIQCPVGKSFTH